jgi:hypothetical protein
MLFLRSAVRLLVTAKIVPSSPILVTLMMEAMCSSETSVLTRAMQRNIPEENILNNKAYPSKIYVITIEYRLVKIQVSSTTHAMSHNISKQPKINQ